MSNPKPRTPSSSPSLSLSQSQFSHSITKVAVAQILRSIGFKSSNSAALETLVRIATLFLQSFSKSAVSHATFSCGRTHCNVFDVVHALEDLSLPFGFNGASDTNQTLLSSKTLKDISLFVNAIDEIPFPRIVPRHVINSGSSVNFCGKYDFSINNRGPEIPKWLPEFPKLETGEDVNVKDKEFLWEEKKCVYLPPTLPKIKKGGKEFGLQGRRERVKFKLMGQRRNAKVGGLELRNGVCRGGKRVGLIKWVDTSCFFQDDDGKDFTNGL